MVDHHLPKSRARSAARVRRTKIQAGDRVEVNVRRVIRDEPVEHVPPTAHGAGLLLALAREPRPGWRTHGSSNVDCYLKK